VTIAIPGGGARGVEVGVEGNTGLSMLLRNEPLAFGPVTARTAQVAAVAAGPAADRSPARAAAPVEPAPVEPEGAIRRAAGDPPAPGLLVATLLGATVLAAGLALAWRGSAARRPSRSG
jgi:hypothetical protein